VYKQCEWLRRRLWKLLKAVRRGNRLPDEWLSLFPEENSLSIKQFCTISLLNLEGKIFFGILASRLTTFLLSKKYIDTSVLLGESDRVSSIQASSKR